MGVRFKGWMLGPMGNENARENSPYYVEYYHTFLVAVGVQTLEEAISFAIDETTGLYKMNGQLNERTVRIFEKGGRLIETYISGFPEEEYKRLKAERELKDEVKVIGSGGWDPSKMR